METLDKNRGGNVEYYKMPKQQYLRPVYVQRKHKYGLNLYKAATFALCINESLHTFHP